MKILSEFKDFVVKGNAIDLSVGVLIGAAFGKVVTAVSDGLVKPMLNAVGGDAEISLKLGIFDVGLVLSALVSLLLTGAVLFFVFVRPMARFQAKPAEPPPGPTTEQLLTEIRDLLKNPRGQ